MFFSVLLVKLQQKHTSVFEKDESCKLFPNKRMKRCLYMTMIRIKNKYQVVHSKKKKIMYVLNGSKNLRNSSHGSRTNQEKKHLCEGKILSRGRRRIFPWQQEKSSSYIRTYFIKYHISRIISSSYNTSLHNTSNRQHLFFMKYCYARVKIKSTLVLAYLWWTMSKCLHEYHLPNFAKYVWISR